MNAGLSRDLGAPLHHQVATVLRSAITSGRYATGSDLPGESALTGMFGVSRATVRRALSTLESERIIDRRQGRATRVIWDPAEVVSTSISTHLRRIERQAQRTDVRVRGIEEVAAPADVAAGLGLAPGARVVRIVRTRTQNGVPMRHMTTYAEVSLGQRIAGADLANVTVIEALRRAGREVRRAEDEVGATLADPVLAEALAVPIGAALLDLARVMFDADGGPVAYQRTVIPPERHKLRLVVEADDEASIGPVADLTVVAPAPTARETP
jgi:GntR family transcriptional regulator